MLGGVRRRQRRPCRHGGPGPTDDHAACFFDPCTAAWSAVHDVGGLLAGEIVLVGGTAGAVGSVAAQLALLAGAGRVYGDVSARHAGDLPEGVTQVVAGEAPAGTGIRVDLLIDTAGGDRLPQSLDMVRPGGRAVVLGYTAGTRLCLDLPNWILADCALLPLNMLRREQDERKAAAITAGLLARGRLTLPVRSYPRNELRRALDDLENGRVRGGRCSGTVIRVARYQR